MSNAISSIVPSTEDQVRFVLPSEERKRPETELTERQREQGSMYAKFAKLPSNEPAYGVPVNAQPLYAKIVRPTAGMKCLICDIVMQKVETLLEPKCKHSVHYDCAVRVSIPVILRNGGEGLCYTCKECLVPTGLRKKENRLEPESTLRRNSDAQLDNRTAQRQSAVVSAAEFNKMGRELRAAQAELARLQAQSEQAATTAPAAVPAAEQPAASAPVANGMNEAPDTGCCCVIL